MSSDAWAILRQLESNDLSICAAALKSVELCLACRISIKGKEKAKFGSEDVATLWHQLASSDFSTLFGLWQSGLHASHTQVTLLAMRCLCIVVKVENKRRLAVDEDPMGPVVASFMQSHLTKLSRSLSTGRLDLNIVCTELCHALVNCAGVSVRKLWSTMALDSKRLALLLSTRRKTPHKDPLANPDLRMLTLAFLLRVLARSSPGLKTEILSLKGLSSNVFKFLPDDHVAIVGKVLATMFETVILDPAVRYDTKLGVIQDSRESCAALLARDQPERVVGGIDIVPAESVERFLLANVAWLASQRPAKIGHGPSAGAVRKTLSMLAQALSKNRLGDDRAESIITAALQDSDALRAGYWSRLAPGLEPRPSSRWIINVGFALRILMLPLALKDGGSGPQTVILDATIPPQLGRAYFAKSFQHPSGIVKLLSAQLLLACAQACQRRLSSLDASARQQFSLELGQRLPDPQVLLGMLSKYRQSDPVRQTTSSEDESLLANAILRCLCTYPHELLRGLRFDSAKLLDTASSPLSALSSQHAMTYMAQSSPALVSLYGATATRSSPFSQLAELAAAEASSPMQTSALRLLHLVLGRSDAFSSSLDEVRIWLAALSSISKDGDTSRRAVICFLDGCILRCSRDHLKYLTKMQQTGEDDIPPAASATTSVCPLLGTCVEQLRYHLDCPHALVKYLSEVLFGYRRLVYGNRALRPVLKLLDDLAPASGPVADLSKLANVLFSRSSEPSEPFVCITSALGSFAWTINGVHHGMGIQRDWSTLPAETRALLAIQLSCTMPVKSKHVKDAIKCLAALLHPDITLDATARLQIFGQTGMLLMLPTMQATDILALCHTVAQQLDKTCDADRAVATVYWQQCHMLGHEVPQLLPMIASDALIGYITSCESADQLLSAGTLEALAASVEVPAVRSFLQDWFQLVSASKTAHSSIAVETILLAACQSLAFSLPTRLASHERQAQADLAKRWTEHLLLQAPRASTRLALAALIGVSQPATELVTASMLNQSEGGSEMLPLARALLAQRPWLRHKTQQRLSQDSPLLRSAIYSAIDGVCDGSSADALTFCLAFWREFPILSADVCTKLVDAIASCDIATAAEPLAIVLGSLAHNVPSQVGSLLTAYLHRASQWLTRQYVETAEDSSATSKLTVSLLRELDQLPDHYLFSGPSCLPLLLAVASHRIASSAPVALATCIARRAQITASDALNVFKTAVSQPTFKAACRPEQPTRGSLIALLCALVSAHPATLDDAEVASVLVSLYDARISPAGRAILEVLRLTERNRMLSLRPALLMWTPDVGMTSSSSLQSLLGLDRKGMRAAFTQTLGGKQSMDPTAYEPVFILAFAVAALEDSELSARDWIGLASTCLFGLAICALASPRKPDRMLGDRFLARCRLRLQEAEFREQPELLLVFEHASHLSDTPRPPGLLALFLAKAVTVIASPGSFLYPAMMRFLLQRAILSADDVPLFYPLLFSTSEKPDRDAAWLQDFLTEGLHSYPDWHALQRRSGFDLLASFGSIASPDSRRKTVQLVLHASHSKRVALELIQRRTITAWLLRHPDEDLDLKLQLACNLVDGARARSSRATGWVHDIISLSSHAEPAERAILLRKVTLLLDQSSQSRTADLPAVPLISALLAALRGFLRLSLDEMTAAAVRDACLRAGMLSSHAGCDLVLLIDVMPLIAWRPSTRAAIAESARCPLEPRRSDDLT
ncbi:uncharacterized protein L969DRAFT_43547 [Mixia osmundae IAM 14324]|uniref:Nucleolar pre-ribosomal-associated protein 1 C-terminal domain-containing protein n=1 Tax=Mixia osmundae (strain CBS 9802 / IAM 14324 / JCM 22182 / KY 12970) TaxID=764103 RepID=G7E866_MIXOS|nr:uncharacterized protein L969DRAFT_43547 [Mixia osmundae IAM 14324]KEI42382.1 hypothetical protein L969DRAFT_43547 [Mixia osmundae IAM 14324]GAA99026.1 hypothetical protein E5Q_05715 [Mixia osmundae IAM 14324]